MKEIYFVTGNENKVKEILADILDIDLGNIKIESDLVKDLEMDSFKAVELTFEIKDKFGIEIPEEDYKKIRKVKDIVEYI